MAATFDHAHHNSKPDQLSPFQAKAGAEQVAREMGLGIVPDAGDNLMPTAAKTADDYLQEAEQYYAQGQWNRAIAACVLALQQSPHTAIAHKRWGDALQQQKNFAAAHHHYQRVLVLQPEDAETHANLGSLHAQQHQWEAAIACYQRALELNPEFAGVYRNLARVLEKVDQPEQAAQYWHHAQALGQSDSTSQSQSNPTRQKQPTFPDPPDSDRSFPPSSPPSPTTPTAARNQNANTPEQIASAHPNPTSKIQNPKSELLFQATELSKQGKFRRAIALYQKASTDYPDEAVWLQRMGHMWGQRGKWQRAAHCYKAALQLDDADPQLHLELAEVLAQSKRWKRAIAHYRAAIQHQPDSWIAHHRLGDALMAQRQWRKAVRAYRQAITLKPDYFWSHHNAGTALLHLQRWSGAATHFERAIAIDDRFYWSHRSLGQAYLRLEREEDAVAQFEEAIGIEPNSPALHCDVGHVFRQRGQFGAAVSAYCRAIACDPTYKQPYVVLQYTPIAPQQLDEVIATYRTAVEHAPNLAAAWGNLGDALTQKDAIDDAIQCYRASSKAEAIAHRPDLADWDWSQPKEQGPDFLIIGAAKCGTSSLHAYLKEHPQMVMPFKKELSFFSVHYERGMDWYLSHFPAVGDRPEFLTGEADPNYFYLPYVAERIAKHLPYTKLIVLLRNPVDRAVSWYHHMVRSGCEGRSFAEVIEADLQTYSTATAENLSYQGGYVLGGLYLDKIKRWFSLFPSEQVLILRSEDLFLAPQAVTRQAFEFLGLSFHAESQYLPYNKGVYQPMEPALRLKLDEFFKPHNAALESFLNRSLAWHVEPEAHPVPLEN